MNKQQEDDFSEEDDFEEDNEIAHSNHSRTKDLTLCVLNRSISETVLRESNFELDLHQTNKTNKDPPNVWTPENESILFEWCDNAQCYIWLHNRSCNQCSFYYSAITIPCIVLSTITGSAALATNSFPPETHFYEFIMIGSINIFVGILNMIEHFLKFSERKESHRLSSISWDKFLRNIRVELAKLPKERMEVGQFLKFSNREYDHLIESSPVISSGIIRQFNQTFSGTPGSSTRKRFDELKKPDICDSMMTTQEHKHKKSKSPSRELDPLLPEDLDSNLQIINVYVDTFQQMFGRKPLVYEIIDHLKTKVQPEILGNFLENYTMEDVMNNV